MGEKFGSDLSLKKVSIALGGGRTFEFILGIGPQGLTPFEYEVSRHAVGEDFDLFIDKDSLHEIFGHLADIVPFSPEEYGGRVLKVSIEGVTEAEPRDVVRAMAEIARCADHCCTC